MFPGHTICIYWISQENTTFYCRMQKKSLLSPAVYEALLTRIFSIGYMLPYLLFCPWSRCKYYLTVLSISTCEISLPTLWPFFSWLFIFLIYFRRFSYVLCIKTLWVIHVANIFFSSSHFLSLNFLNVCLMDVNA